MRTVAILLGLIPVLVSFTVSAQPDYDALEAAIAAETNVLRADPSAYADRLRPRVSRYDGRMYTDINGNLMQTREGVSAVLEAISELVQTESTGSLKRVSGLDKAAHDHVVDQRNGRVGHVGSDGTQPYQRVTRRFEWDLITVENIYYGEAETAQEVIECLLIDDGVGNRGHRRALLDERVQVTGVSCGPHKKYGMVCVMEYAVPQKDVVYASQDFE